MTPPDDTPHRLALWRLVKVAQAIALADGANGDLERIYLDSQALWRGVHDAREYARVAGRGRWRDAWTLLADACETALRHIVRDDDSEPERRAACQWRAIVGALYPLVLEDWQDWRDARAPKLGGAL